MQKAARKGSLKLRIHNELGSLNRITTRKKKVAKVYS
jgi:hypothetical protein